MILHETYAAADMKFRKMKSEVEYLVGKKKKSDIVGGKKHKNIKKTKNNKN